jgi:hypothetical protein
MPANEIECICGETHPADYWSKHFPVSGPTAPPRGEPVLPYSERPRPPRNRKPIWWGDAYETEDSESE